MSTYLLVDIAAISIPFLFSFHPKIPFYKFWKFHIPATFIVGIFFLIWDVIFTGIGIWGFNDLHLLGGHLLGLPLEEYLFFFCIPYACTFTYFALRQLIPSVQIKAEPILGILSGVLLIIAIWKYDHLYTSVTFILQFLFLRFLLFRKPSFLDHAVLAYLLLLIPFFLTNGILTGSWIEEEVVWYNDHHNLGIRLWTIPIEDSIYGMLMILANIYLFEFFLQRANKSTSNQQGLSNDTN